MGEGTLDRKEEETCAELLDIVECRWFVDDFTTEVDCDIADNSLGRVAYIMLVLKLVFFKAVVKSMILDWLDVDALLGAEDTLDGVEGRRIELLDETEWSFKDVPDVDFTDETVMCIVLLLKLLVGIVVKSVFLD